MACSARVVVQAQLVETERGLVPKGDGWFVLNARETQWWMRSGLGTLCDFEGEPRFRQEGEERTIRQWDFVHCPPGTNHAIIGAGTAPCLVLAVGARDNRSKGQDWGAYTVDETALRHGAGVQRETAEGSEAYARFPPYKLTRYRDGRLPD